MYDVIYSLTFLALDIINHRIHMTVAPHNPLASTTHLIGGTTVVVEYFRHKGVHLQEMRFGNGFCSALGRKHQMNVYFR